MAIDDFVEGLKELGFSPVLSGNRVTFPYTIDAGKHLGTQIELGFTVDANFPLVPPTGPRIKPRLYPIHPGSDLPHPLGAVHEAAEYGVDWEYWSRPINGWAELPIERRTAKTYMKHIQELFAKIDP